MTQNQLEDQNIIDKTVCFLGDSITDNENYYLKDLNEKLTFTNQYNLANSGAKWAHESTTAYDITSTGGLLADWNVVWNQFNKLKSKVDALEFVAPELIVISCGTNDFSTSSVGVPSGIYDGLSFISLSANDIRTRSVAGGIRYTLDSVITEYPDAQIILITPLQRGVVDNSKIFSITEVIKLCSDFSATKIINQTSESGIYGYIEVGADKYLIDNLHPTVLGGKKMANFLNKELIYKVEL